MSGKRITPKIGVLLGALLLFVGFYIVCKFGTTFLDDASVLSEYVNAKQREISLEDNLINCYIPVVGYVDSHYVDDSFAGDPAYELIDITENIVNENKTTVDDVAMNENQTTINDAVMNENQTTINGIAMNENESDGIIVDGNALVDSEKIVDETKIPDQDILETSINLDSNLPATRTSIKLQKSNLLNLTSLIKNYYTVTSITELTEKKFNVPQALDTDLSIKQDNSAPQILIFHTHSQEEFKDSIKGDVNTSIVAVGAELSRILSTEYGYSVIHDTSVYDYVNGVLDRSKAYTYAERGVAKILEQYPSVEVVLDIHRDGVDDSVHLVTDIDGKKTARFMLFNGISYTKVNGDISYLQNPYVQDNLAMSLQMYLLGKVYYPDLLRKNYVNGYRYCLHLRPKSMLIEVGAQNNTLEEELNAMIPLADLLNRVLSGEKAYE